MSASEWTTTPPTVEGFYWGSDDPDDPDDPVVVLVTKVQPGDGFLVMYPGIDEERGLTLDIFSYWLGPLPQPAPPTVTP